MEIGRELFEGISAPLSKIDKSFVDMRKMQGRFMPVHGNAWNSFEGLVGESIGLQADDSDSLKSYHLTKENKCSASVEFHYVCF